MEKLVQEKLLLCHFPCKHTAVRKLHLVELNTEKGIGEHASASILHLCPACREKRLNLCKRFMFQFDIVGLFLN